MSTVCVTGGSGFVGLHCILKLLQAGHAVHTTVRSTKKIDLIKQTIKQNGGDPASIKFFEADLSQDRGWAEAIANTDYVLHVASPFPMEVPKDENDLIVPARDGALRVMRAAKKANVKRVVMTSSFAAVGYGHADKHPQAYTEDDWTNTEGSDVSPYIKSKAVAEKAAWDYCNANQQDLAVINPVGIFGPALNNDLSTSIQIIQRMLEGKMPGNPDISFGIVDVRDVAELHLRAMTAPQASGQRYIAVAGDDISIQETAELLKRKLGAKASKVKMFRVPNFVVHIVALWDHGARQVKSELGKRIKISNAKARTQLAWTPIPNEEAILASAESLIRLGLIRN